MIFWGQTGPGIICISNAETVATVDVQANIEHRIASKTHFKVDSEGNSLSCHVVLQYVLCVPKY